MLFSIVLTTISGLSTIIPILLTYINYKRIDRLICISLSLAFSTMILISIKELIPIPIKYIINNNKSPYLLYIIPIILIILIRIFNNKDNNNLYRVGIINAIILLIHNIPEGIITFISSYTNKELGTKLALGIIAHNIPEGISIAVPIYYATKSRGKALIYTLIAGLSEPIGGLLIFLLLKKNINITIMNYLLYIIGNLMIIISFNNLLPSIIKYKNISFFLYGVGLSLIILFI